MDWLQHIMTEAEAYDRAKNSKEASAYAYGVLGHAAADVFAHTYVNMYAGGVFDLTDETLVEQRHFLLEGYIGRYTPPLKDQNGQVKPYWEAVEMSQNLGTFIRDSLVYHPRAQEQFRKADFTAHLAAYKSYRDAIESMAEDGIHEDIHIAVTILVAAAWGVDLSREDAQKITQAGEKIADVLTNEVAEGLQQADNDLFAHALRLEEAGFDGIRSFRTRLEEAESKLFSTLDELHDSIRKREREARRKVTCKKDFFGVDHPLGCRDINKAIDKILDQIDGDIRNVRDKATKDRAEVRDAAFALRDQAIVTVQAVRDIQNAFIDMHQVLTSGVNPVQQLMRNWVTDIDYAMVEYVRAANQSIVNTVDPSKGAFDPMMEWFECYHASLIGLPRLISGCEFKGGFQRIQNAFKAVKTAFEDAIIVGDLPTPSQFESWIQELQERAIDELKEEVAEELVDLLPAEVQEIIETLNTVATDAELNRIFTTRSDKPNALPLVLLPDAAARVRYDMGASCGGAFDPQRFAPVYNAVVMAKLALLDEATFSAMASKLGSTSYTAWVGNLENLVASAFTNIDGNHQWMEVAPPLPNNLDQYTMENISYSTNRKHVGGVDEGGFIPWRDDMKYRIFNRLFIGPIAAALPKGPNYPFKACSANPFPYGIADNTCNLSADAYNVPVAQLGSPLACADPTPPPSSPEPSTVEMCTWEYSWSSSRGGGGGLWGPVVDGRSCSSSNLGSVYTKSDAGANYRFVCTSMTVPAANAGQVGGEFARCQ